MVQHVTMAKLIREGHARLLVLGVENQLGFFLIGGGGGGGHRAARRWSLG